MQADASSCQDRHHSSQSRCNVGTWRCSESACQAHTAASRSSQLFLDKARTTIQHRYARMPYNHWKSHQAHISQTCCPRMVQDRLLVQQLAQLVQQLAQLVQQLAQLVQQLARLVQQLAQLVQQLAQSCMQAEHIGCGQHSTQSRSLRLGWYAQAGMALG